MPDFFLVVEGERRIGLMVTMMLNDTTVLGYSVALAPKYDRAPSLTLR